MALTTGTRIGPYEIKSSLGEGGMGIVFRALDTKLQREVALKLLPDHFADDEERLARFQREAQILASLNHPNIAQIHGLEESGNMRCIVMELVEGETLADRIARGAIPVDEALKIGRSICEALEAAHEKGIIHRDLKPANVKITSNGEVKVLDFGLAKTRDVLPADAVLSNSPTMLSQTTGGVILGTAAYMSPEQARGRAADQRIDIFSFGCVLYEMLTGKQAFEGEDMAEILGAVLKTEPDWTRLSAGVPPAVRKLLARCLAKDAKKRRRHAGDVLMDLEDAMGGNEVEHAQPAARGSRIPWTVAAIMAVLVIGIGVIHLTETSPPAPVTAFDLPLPEGTSGGGAFLSLSRDGTKLAFTLSEPDGKAYLWLRQMDSLQARRIAGTEGAGFPFWSPDGRFVAFFADDSIKKVAVDGSTPQVVCKTLQPGRGTWNSKGDILFSVGEKNGIFRVADSGGVAQEITKPDSSRGESAHSWPQFLPDDEHFLYLSISKGKFTAMAASLDSKDTKPIAPVDSAVFYSPPGSVVFGRQGSLVAQRFDPKSLELLGEATPIAALPTPSPIGSISASISHTGILANRIRPQLTNEIGWYDRNGKLLEKIGEPGIYLAAAVSGDGKRIAVERRVNDMTPSDVWTFDTRGVMSRMTFSPANDAAPQWSEDGRWVYFTNGTGIYRKAAAGGADEELIYKDENGKTIASIATDNRLALLTVTPQNQGGTQRRDIWILDSSSGKASSLLATEFREHQARFSADGKWIAYTSNQSGRDEVYIRPYPFSGDQWQISTAGGNQPKWRRDGKELFYSALDGKMMAVSIRTIPKFEPGIPQILFQMPSSNAYEVAGNGQRFLLNSILDDSPSAITITLNWPSLIKSR